MKREIIEYIETVDAVAVEYEQRLHTDEEMVAEVACIYLNSGQLFSCWLWSMRGTIRSCLSAVRTFFKKNP